MTLAPSMLPPPAVACQGPVAVRSQGETLDELRADLQEVIAMLLEDGKPKLEAEFIGIQTVAVAS